MQVRAQKRLQKDVFMCVCEICGLELCFFPFLPSQMALYFCTGSFHEEKLFKHYALNVPLYTHFTSPIRRYADVLVHRLLAASLSWCHFS